MLQADWQDWPVWIRVCCCPSWCWQSSGWCNAQNCSLRLGFVTQLNLTIHLHTGFEELVSKSLACSCQSFPQIWLWINSNIMLLMKHDCCPFNMPAVHFFWQNETNRKEQKIHSTCECTTLRNLRHWQRRESFNTVTNFLHLKALLNTSHERIGSKVFIWTSLSNWI